MLHAKMDLKSMAKYLDKFVSDVGDANLDAAVVEALDKVADFLLYEMQYRVWPHHRQGNAYDAIKRTEVKTNGHEHWVYVGALEIRTVDKKGFHIVYQEYGSPTMKADPWLRPSMEQRSAIRKIIKDTFKKWGVHCG
jgi:HK97 gp10 family phage protein